MMTEEEIQTKAKIWRKVEALGPEEALRRLSAPSATPVPNFRPDRVHRLGMRRSPEENVHAFEDRVFRKMSDFLNRGESILAITEDEHNHKVFYVSQPQ